MMPLLQVMVFGYAVTTDVRNVPTAVLDFDQSVASRELLSRFFRFGLLPVRVADPKRTTTATRSPRPGNRWGRSCASTRASRKTCGRAGRPAPGDRRRDGLQHRRDRARLHGADRRRILRAGPPDPVAAPPRRRASPPGSVELVSRAWFNENLESRNFYVPGVIAIIVMLVTLMLTSMAVVREKEIGTIEQIMVSPITPAEFILGKTLPFALIGYADVLLVAALGVFWFEVPIRGSLPPAPRGHDVLPDDHAGDRAFHLHGQPHAAAGDDERLLLLLPRDAPLRIHVPDREHAPAGADASPTPTRCGISWSSCGGSS